MSTAHRPTWAPAKGGETDEQGGSRVFAPTTFFRARDQLSQTRLKFRKPGQGTKEEVKQRDLQIELQDREQKHFHKKGDNTFEEQRQADLLLLQQAPQSLSEKPRTLVPNNRDADDEESEADSDAEGSDDDDEDDEKALLAELARIRAERKEEADKKAAEAAAQAQSELQEELIRGNPLIAGAADGEFAIKRRWDEDVVFRNQTRHAPKAQKRFINDTIRSDFHRRFLARYVR